MSTGRDVGLFVALAAIWGTAFVAIKAGLSYFPPVLFAALRYDIAGLLMLGYAVAAVDQWRPHTKGEWSQVVVGAVLLIAAYHAFLFVGEQSVTSATAAIVVSLSPVLTTGFARVLLPDQRLSTLGALGLAAGFAGVVIVARPTPDAVFSADVVAVGLVFAAATAFALGSVLSKRIAASLPIETMEAWSMLGGAAIMHAVSYLLPGEAFADVIWNGEALAALGYLAVVASALGFLVYFELLDRLGPVEINLVSYVAPVFAAVAGWALLGEVIDAGTALGFAAIVFGFALLKRRAIARKLSAA
ncbi:Permease of the drug/metabolite transporter (DMT) superfamily [Natronoarchaeum philippinense]|uniref:Permease of the drug/metabolite transporter (DMT) superfamily n=1 Tax=Natronoarchaeum philippinense TaxID=558529 RepID=A0A285NCA0_NATPI|nr:DMT family transporter [Natronoarchaeum philippinense]SNZ05576.1 Permease of the drug/metabolite transporter (DMT) superfamily [Natronoarchaeum philippinense]